MSNYPALIPNDSVRNELAERISKLRFMDIANLCQQVKGGALGFDFNRRFGGEEVKAKYGGIKRGFAFWAVNELPNDSLLAKLPTFEDEAQRFYASRKTTWNAQKRTWESGKTRRGNREKETAQFLQMLFMLLAASQHRSVTGMEAQAEMRKMQNTHNLTANEMREAMDRFNTTNENSGNTTSLGQLLREHIERMEQAENSGKVESPPIPQKRGRGRPRKDSYNMQGNTPEAPTDDETDDTEGLTVGDNNAQDILKVAKATAAAMDAQREQNMMGVVSELEKKIDRLNKARPMILTVVKSDETVTNELPPQHHMFTRLLKLAATRKSNGDALNIWMTGPAGSGKTMAAANVAKALSIEFHFTGAVKDEFKLLGFTDAHGRTVRTPFREAYEKGGVFLFDEVDGSDAAALLAFNAALANGQCDFPDKIVPRHKDCVIIAAANTWGSGPTAKYMGRAKLDAASLNRFVMLPWEYDETLEMLTSGNEDWCGKVQAMRKRCGELGIDHVISPRATYDGAALLANGFDVADVASMTIRAGMSDAQWTQVTRGIV